jgi:ankyrin repeat protein
MSRVEELESTSQANFKEKGQVLGSWKEYEAFRFPFPMHEAALLNDCDAVAEYLHAKNGCYRVDINSVDSCGRTICHICAIEGHLELLLFILDRRPNLEIKDCDVSIKFDFFNVFLSSACLVGTFLFALGLDCPALVDASIHSSCTFERRLQHQSQEPGDSLANVHLGSSLRLLSCNAD